MSIYSELFCKKANKQIAILVDPDKGNDAHFAEIAQIAQQSAVDYIFVGGSLLTKDNMDTCIETIKKYFFSPVVLFPGNTLQISKKADAILFLSLISGRNPETLIGKHVMAAPYLKQTSLEIISTGYMLIESGTMTSVQYMSNSLPIPADKSSIAVCTAMAGEMLGLKVIYMDAGSGAKHPIPAEMISLVKQNISSPLIIGGGINTIEKAISACHAGADIIVVGNAAENNPQLISEIANQVHSIK